MYELTDHGKGDIIDSALEPEFVADFIEQQPHCTTTHVARPMRSLSAEETAVAHTGAEASVATFALVFGSRRIDRPAPPARHCSRPFRVSQPDPRAATSAASF